MSKIFSVIDDVNASSISGGILFKGPTTLVQSVDQLNVAKPKVSISPIGGKGSRGRGSLGYGMPSLNIASIGNLTLLNSATLNAAAFSA